jgi:hypothetical protein
MTNTTLETMPAAVIKLIKSNLKSMGKLKNKNYQETSTLALFEVHKPADHS